MPFVNPSYKKHMQAVGQSAWQTLAGNTAHLRDVCYPVPFACGGGEADNGASAMHATLQHYAKFLVYRELPEREIKLVHERNGELTFDLTPVGDDAEPDAVGVQDLNDVDWLQPGVVYRVTGALFAFESFFI